MITVNPHVPAAHNGNVIPASFPGVVAEVKQVMRVSDDLVRILVEGKYRAKLSEMEDDGKMCIRDRCSLAQNDGQVRTDDEGQHDENDADDALFPAGEVELLLDEAEEDVYKRQL